MMPRKGVVLSLRRAAADRDGSGDGLAFQAFADLFQRVVEVGADHIHLVDEDQPRHLIFVGLPPDGFRLGLDAFLGVEDDHAAVEDAQERSTSAVKSTWPGVSIRLMVQLAPLERDAGAVDGDAAFLFFGVAIGCRCCPHPRRRGVCLAPA